VRIAPGPADLFKAWQRFGPYRRGGRGRPPTDLPEPGALRSVAESAPVLDYILEQNILPFWFPGAICPKGFGFRLDHGLSGGWGHAPARRLIAQARTVWFLAHLIASGRGTQAHWEAAAAGYAFLRDHMWDPEHGGFFWEVDVAQEAPSHPEKSICAQAFGLFALSEYALALGDRPAEALARQLFDLLDRHAYDPDHPGYLEMLSRDWRGMANIHYLGTDPGHKTMNTHLHLLEAVHVFFKLTGEPRARARLEELAHIMSHVVFSRWPSASTKAHRRDWTPLTGPPNRTVSYGHDFENIWMLADLDETLSGKPAARLDLYRTVFDATVARGYDCRKGGFYQAGPVRGRTLPSAKVWWVQAEALLAALWMFVLTDHEPYARCYFDTLDWIVERQVDWRHGEWFAEIAPNGRPLGVKAGPWKTPYHNGRAMLDCLRLLERRGDGPAA